MIAGAGIAGLTLGLTLHQIGVPFRIYEAVRKLRPLGVGINLQPNAVRELFDLGLEAKLDQIGVRTQDYGFYTKYGLEIWTEPRGIAAGYAWPQFSVHRGELQMMLYQALVERAGADCVVFDAHATGFGDTGDHALLSTQTAEIKGDVLIACDGINSAVRAQMVPGEGDALWNGVVLWRGMTRAPVFKSDCSMVLCGHDTQRFVAYPITPAGADGLATINWLAELTRDPSQGWRKDDWNQGANPDDFAPAFSDWRFDWLDVPALIAGADRILEYPMVDRDPLDHWTKGRVTLMGDAAHPTYPVGSSGASQAIVDARVLGASFLKHGVGTHALSVYEDTIRPTANAVTLANRGAGPDAILQMVEDRCGGKFEEIDDVIAHQELADHALRYKKLAGFSIAELNASPPIIGPV